jgi:hypothetical protein
MKPLQLRAAVNAGLRVPETLITNDPEEAENFVRRLWDEGKEVVYKRAAVFQEVGVLMRLVGEEDLRRAIQPLLLSDYVSRAHKWWPRPSCRYCRRFSVHSEMANGSVVMVAAEAISSSGNAILSG